MARTTFRVRTDGKPFKSVDARLLAAHGLSVEMETVAEYTIVKVEGPTSDVRSAVEELRSSFSDLHFTFGVIEEAAGDETMFRAAVIKKTAKHGSIIRRGSSGDMDKAYLVQPPPSYAASVGLLERMASWPSHIRKSVPGGPQRRDRKLKETLEP
ncbi:uncharacterized protein EV422DRAFT_505980 [Fimicolochytrium jonesii]|uniref:uncharacterized protein n=1 Tax=Fimicolochytrium jonesii TaxID=1396493 RepID=UPI0022FF32D7|nr:uncharacterized protein EV422DRAFT_505980 [Fimicolochytrium jonesii]KAI8821268.1 hypothetical protein EV422DRAFT_505980 [Fimicolochytrium jonesii]